MGISRLTLEVRNVTKTYKRYKNTNLIILEDSSLEISKGETVSVVGTSGCGKTTLLQVCGLLDGIDSGEIIINSKSVSGLNKNDKTEVRKNNIGFIYQAHHLFSEFNVLENVMLPLLVNNENKKKARESAADLLGKLGLYKKLSSMPHELSGGERQRVAVARAIVSRPSLILADEPTGNLDGENSEKVLDILLKLVGEFDLSLLIVTHDVNIAKKTDKVLTIRDKKVVYY